VLMLGVGGYNIRACLRTAVRSARVAPNRALRQQELATVRPHEVQLHTAHRPLSFGSQWLYRAMSLFPRAR
jgi:hypothetical protein